MGLFNLFKKKKAKQEPVIKKSSEKIRYDFTDEQLTGLSDKAITVFYDNKENDVEDVIQALEVLTNGDKACTDALYRFIPIVLCQKLFHEATYPGYYMVLKLENDYTEHLYSDDQAYNVVERLITQKLSQNQLSEDEIYAILAHSSTFDVLNQALNGGSQLSDLEFSPCIFLNQD